MTQATKTTILTTAKKLFAEQGYEGVSMRILSKASGVGLSSIYHFFADKDVLLKEIFDKTNTDLGRERALLPTRRSARKMLQDRIEFQIDHMEDIVFVLKYYLHYRPQFFHLSSGYVPAKAYLHIEEVLQHGVNSGELDISAEDIPQEAKVITHAINGFLLEYYPDTPKPKERRAVVNALHSFIMRALLNPKEVPMKHLS